MQSWTVSGGKIDARGSAHFSEDATHSSEDASPRAASSSCGCAATGMSKVSFHSGSKFLTLTLVCCRNTRFVVSETAVKVQKGSDVYLNCAMSFRGRCSALMMCTRHE